MGDLGSIPGSGRSAGEGNGNPLQYYCLEKSHGQRSLVGYSPWGRKETDTTERLHLLTYFTYVPCLLTFYAEYIMLNARLEDLQPGIKIARRNINNLRYADDTILIAESKEELKSFLVKVKEESENSGLKLNI